MHPGNILVRMSRSRHPSKGLFKPRPHLVFLDVGLIAELSSSDRINLLEFFKAVALRDGRTAAICTLRFSKRQKCPNPDNFIEVRLCQQLLTCLRTINYFSLNVISCNYQQLLFKGHKLLLLFVIFFGVVSFCEITLITLVFKLLFAVLLGAKNFCTLLWIVRMCNRKNFLLLIFGFLSTGGRGVLQILGLSRRRCLPPCSVYAAFACASSTPQGQYRRQCLHCDSDNARS